MRKTTLMILLSLLVATTSTFAQTSTPTPSPTSPLTPPALLSDEKPKPKTDGDNLTFGRFEITGIGLQGRYRDNEKSDGTTTSSELQFKFDLSYRVRLDSKDKYSIVGSLNSGNSFTGGWNSTGIGVGNPGTLQLFPKQLYFSAKPWKGVEFQAGSIGINRGQGTEITTYDNDGYLMGVRATIKRPKNLWFDEVSVTSAHLGDLKTPNAFRRFGHFGDSNYQQFLVAKNIGKRAVVSADLTNQWGVTTLRQAALIKTPEFKVVDRVRVEVYERLENRPANGFSVYGEKSLTKAFTVGGGYASIDRNYGDLNGDRFFKGNRLFTQASYNLNDYVQFQAFYQHSVATNYAIGNRNRLDLLVSFNVLKFFKNKF